MRNACLDLLPEKPLILPRTSMRLFSYTACNPSELACRYNWLRFSLWTLRPVSYSDGSGWERSSISDISRSSFRRIWHYRGFPSESGWGWLHTFSCGSISEATPSAWTYSSGELRYVAMRPARTLQVSLSLVSFLEFVKVPSWRASWSSLLCFTPGESRRLVLATFVRGLWSTTFYSLSYSLTVLMSGTGMKEAKSIFLCRHS